MAGVDRRTGKVLSGWAHTVQSCFVLFSTGIGWRIRRRTFGSAVPATLGRDLNEATMLRLKTAIIVALELWEPRVTPLFAFERSENSPDRLRSGRLGISVTCIYRPRGHLGDPTPEDQPRQLDL